MNLAENLSTSCTIRLARHLVNVHTTNMEFLYKQSCDVPGLKKYVYNIMQRVPGLLAVVVTDRDGVPVLKVAMEGAPELALRPGFLATFGMATDQASKMGLSRNKSIICMYSSYQIVHFNRQPLMVSLVATNASNTGLLLSLEVDLDVVLHDLTLAVSEASSS